MAKYVDLTGKRYGRLVVVEKRGVDRGKKSLWLCKCDCGSETIARSGDLNSGRHKSCGCYQKDVTSYLLTTHGMTHTPEYNCWSQMIQRCHNTNNPSYPYYGERGIRVCDEWRYSFARFHADMGPKPDPDWEIDRINNDGDYEPGNCRWTTHTTNLRNTRRNHLVTFNNKTMCLSEWAEETGIHPQTICYRVKTNKPLIAA